VRKSSQKQRMLLFAVFSCSFASEQPRVIDRTAAVQQDVRRDPLHAAHADGT
jgi:hypothetical protein